MNPKKHDRSSKCPGKAAVFLDRDGTIIHDRGYLKSPAEVSFYEQTFSALQRLQAHFELFIVTNQVGIAEGMLTPAEVEQVNQHVTSVLAAQGVHIRDTYVCPHRGENDCPCRKPKPYFLKQAAARHGIDLTASFTVGDHPCDVLLGTQVGACGVYVCTGHGSKHVSELPAQTPVCADILAAAKHILSLGTPRPCGHMQPVSSGPWEQCPGRHADACRSS